MTQNVILHGCDHERSRLSVDVKIFLSDLHHLLVSTHVMLHCNLIASFSSTLEQSLTKKWSGKERREVNYYKGNDLTNIDSCDANYAMQGHLDVK